MTNASSWTIKGKRPKFPTEAWVKKQVKSQLEQLGAWYFMPYGAGMGRSGIPDFICCCKGLFASIEVKKSGGKVSKLQEAENKGISLCGGWAYLVDENGLQRLWAALSSFYSPISHYHNRVLSKIDLRGADK